MRQAKWLTPEIFLMALCSIMIPWLVFTTSSIYELKQEVAVIRGQLTLLVKGFADTTDGPKHDS